MAPSAEGQEVINVASGLTGVASVAVILRIAARLRRRAKFGVDDGLSVGAWLALLGILGLVVQCKCFRHGLVCLCDSFLTDCFQGVRMRVWDITRKN